MHDLYKHERAAGYSVRAGLPLLLLVFPTQEESESTGESYITHSALGELDVSLIAPDGNEVVLFDDPAAAIGGPRRPQISFTLDDEAESRPLTLALNKSIIFQPESLGAYLVQNQSSLGHLELNVRDEPCWQWHTERMSVTVCEDPSQASCQ